MSKEDLHEALHILEKIDESLEYANCSNFEKVLLSHLKLLTKSHSWIENQTSLANALKRQELKLKERELDLMKEQNDALVRISEELKASRKGWVL
jgi:hypothetical protein|tara:strand:- start:74 stop:358 length:285 start_codon:yes stop_codon:yes gene_type:complete